MKTTKRKVESKPLTIIQWAKKWSRNNVRALKYQEQGNQFACETWLLHASIAKDFITINMLQDIQLTKLKEKGI